MLAPSLTTELTLEIVALVNKNNVLKDNCLSESWLFTGRLCRNANTFVISNVDLYFGKGGLSLKTAFTALDTKGCEPALWPPKPW